MTSTLAGKRIARPRHAVVLLACLLLVSGASQALSSAVINFRSVARRSFDLVPCSGARMRSAPAACGPCCE